MAFMDDFWQKLDDFHSCNGSELDESGKIGQNFLIPNIAP